MNIEDFILIVSSFQVQWLIENYETAEGIYSKFSIEF